MGIFEAVPIIIHNLNETNISRAFLVGIYGLAGRYLARWGSPPRPEEHTRADKVWHRGSGERRQDICTNVMSRRQLSRIEEGNNCTSFDNLTNHRSTISAFADFQDAGYGWSNTHGWDW